MTTKATILANLADLLTPDGSGNLALDQSPPQFDNGLNLVTSAFVQRALGNISTTVLVNTGTGYTIPASAAGTLFDFQIGFTGPVTLPLSSTLNVGASYIIYNGTSSPLTVQRTSAPDSLWPSNTALNSITIGVGDSVICTVYSLGLGYICWAGAGVLSYSNSFSSTLAANGYQKFPSGLIIQWGVGTFSTSGLAITFPIAFPNGLYSVYTGNNVSSNVFSTAVTVTSTGFTGYLNTGANANCYWLAIGH